jgi:hypothetical protein
MVSGVAVRRQQMRRETTAMTLKETQAMKNKQVLEFLDRKSLVCRQGRASTRSHAPEVRLSEAFPGAGARSAM